jgi:uncharacterized RDD family membrane protein YckC
MTHSSVAESVDLASLGQRLAGQCIDGLVAAVPVLVGAAITALLSRVGIALILVGILFAILYHLLADGLEGGQSLGKRLVGIRVVSERTGAPCTFGQSFLRNLVLTLLGPIDWIFIFGDKRQRLGDKAAGTIVVLD